ncbi:hypothetical protein [Cloacibacterium normanense]
MKKLFLFLLISLFFSFSCKKDIIIVEAYYTNWFGGVKDVRGKDFMMVIDKETSKNLQIKYFLINDKKFNVEVEEKGNTIEVKSRISEGIDKEIELNNPIEKNSFGIEYYNTKTKKTKVFKLKKLQYKPRSNQQEKVS